MRRTSAIALATLLLAAAPARAGWQRTAFVDTAGQPATPPALNLKAVGVGTGGKVWAVGGSSTASFIVSSADGFQTAQQETGCASIVKPLNAIWVAPDGSYVHAFGNGNSHAAWNGSAWSCANFANPAGITLSININGIAFSDSANGYLVGGAPLSQPTLPLVIQYSGGTLTDASNHTLSFGPASLVARSPTSGAIDYSIGGRLLKHNQGAPFVTVGSNITSLFLLGDSGLFVAQDPALTRKIDAAASTATAPAGTLMDFQPVLGVTLAPKNFALAVGQVSTTEVSLGAIAQSDDGGDNWRRIDLSAISPPVKVLRAVACWDENHCVAVGANDLTLTGGSGYAPELLVYTNQAPTASVAVNGGATPIYDDADVTLAAIVSDPEGDPATLTWYGPTVVDGSHSATVSFTPSLSCSTQNLLHSIEVTDGRLTSSQNVPVLVTHKLRPPSFIALSPAPSAGRYDWQVGSSHTLTGSATLDCGRPVTYGFQVSGAVPAPTSVVGPSATFDLPASLGCGGQDGNIHLTVTDSGDSSLSASRDFPVHVVEVVEAPQVSLTSGTNIEVAYASSLSATAKIDSHCSGTDPALFDYAWSCDPGNTSPTILFKNDGDACGSQFACQLTVTPKGPGLPATVDFTVKLLPASGQGSVSLKGLGDTVTLQPGESVAVEAQTSVFCKPSLAWSCSCSGAPIATPDPGTAASWTFTNPNPNCVGGSCTCEVTASDGTQTAKKAVQFVLQQSAPPTVVSVEYEGSQQVPGGGSVTARVEASNACATEFDWSWTCSGAVAPTDPKATSMVFASPGDNCADEPVSCVAKAMPVNGPGTAGQQTVEVTYLAVAQPPTGVEIASVTVDGARVVATARAVGPCPEQGDFTWTGWIDGGRPYSVVGKDFDHTFEVCGKATVHLEVRLAQFVARTDPEVFGASGVPTVTVEGSNDLHKTVTLDCERAETFTLAPQASTACGVTWVWTQTSGPSLETSESEGVLTLKPDPSALADLWESEVAFEVVALTNGNASEPAKVHVRFEPPPFVTLIHDADRRSATAGEPVHFTLRAATHCVQALDKVMDLQVTLNGLELIPGECKVDGVSVADPTIELVPDPADATRTIPRLVFGGLRTPQYREDPTTVTYYARRQTSASGVVVSEAVARLHTGERPLISKPSQAGGRPPVRSIALSCRCTEAGGGPGGLLALFAVVTSLARRRRRPNSSC